MARADLSIWTKMKLQVGTFILVKVLSGEREGVENPLATAARQGSSCSQTQTVPIEATVAISTPEAATRIATPYIEAKM